jgi:hypothetical protein
MDLLNSITSFFKDQNNPVKVYPSNSGDEKKAVPIDAKKMEEIFKIVTYSSDKINLLLALVDNIESISEKTFFETVDNVYDKDKKNKFFEMFHCKIESISEKTFIKIIHSTYDVNEKFKFFEMFFCKLEKVSSNLIKKIYDDTSFDDDKRKFLLRYKDLILNAGIDPMDLLKDTRSKHARNKIREIFDLPLEHIENRGEGFEIFGQFKKLSDFEIGKEYIFKSKNTKYAFTKFQEPNIFDIRFEKPGQFSSMRIGIHHVMVFEEDTFHRE